LLLTLQPGASEPATFTANTAADLIAALNEANSTGTTNTITLTADITLIAVDNAAFNSGRNGLPVITSAITIAGQGHTIHRDSGAPEFRLLAVSNTGDLTLQDTTLSGGTTGTTVVGYGSLRVRPRSLGGITQFSDHQANGGQVNKRQGIPDAILEILGQAPTPIQPRQRPFHNPAFGEHGKAFGLSTPGNDLDGQLGSHCGKCLLELGPLIGPVRKQLR